MNLIDVFRPAPVNPVIARIEAALEAGLDVTAAIDALDDLEGDPDYEPEPLEGGVGDRVFLSCICSCGHRHALGAYPDHERIDIS